MINASLIISFLIMSLIGTIIVTIYFGDAYLANKAKKWDVVEPKIEGDLKTEFKKFHSFSDAKYMQCIVGIWVFANIEAKDAKKLMKFHGNTRREEAAISEIQLIQKKIRVWFLFRKKNFNKTCTGQFLSSLVKLLKQTPQKKLLSQTEQDVVAAFYEKHRDSEYILKRKIVKSNLTFTENAIMRFQTAFNHYVCKLH